MAKLLLPPVLALGLAAGFVTAGAGGEKTGSGSAGSSSLSTSTSAPPETVTVPQLVDGKTAAWWARRSRQNARNAKVRGLTVRRLRRTLASSPTVLDAIGLASVVYGVSRSTLLRKARCESGLSPAAHNPSGATGLFQFLLSTWRGTPFAGFSPWDPLASALAAGWMHRVGRGGEWECR